MKLDDLINEYTLSKPAIEVVEKEKHELKYFGSLRKVPGHRLFSFNRKTFEIKEVKFEKQFQWENGKFVEVSKVTIEPNCFYEQALNKKNFVKRLIRRGIIIKKV